jgi:hypothetical protein
VALLLYSRDTVKDALQGYGHLVFGRELGLSSVKLAKRQAPDLAYGLALAGSAGAPDCPLSASTISVTRAPRSS